MITSEAEYIIVGRDCNECVDNCTAGMRYVTDKCTENETRMSRDQQKGTLNNKIQKCSKQCVKLKQLRHPVYCSEFTARVDFTGRHVYCHDV